MIEQYANTYPSKKDDVIAALAAMVDSRDGYWYTDYRSLLESAVLPFLEPVGERYDALDLRESPRVHEIDDGDYQGTLLFAVTDNSYQPDQYVLFKVGYGSCSGCDTIQSAGSDVNQLWTLCLHMVQSAVLV